MGRRSRLRTSPRPERPALISSPRGDLIKFLAGVIKRLGPMTLYLMARQIGGTWGCTDETRRARHGRTARSREGSKAGQIPGQRP